MMDASKITDVVAFPTHLLVYDWPDSKELNQGLKELILERERTGTSITKSNVGGYHSDWDLLTWEHPKIPILIERMRQMATQMSYANGLPQDAEVDMAMTAWANVMRDNNWHALHRHPNNFWSGIYYISLGEMDETIKNNGVVEFIDPRPGANMLTSESIPCGQYQVPPKEGRMAMFPSYLAHFVHPYIGTDERISVSFNVLIIDKDK